MLAWRPRARIADARGRGTITGTFLSHGLPIGSISARRTARVAGKRPSQRTRSTHLKGVCLKRGRNRRVRRRPLVVAPCEQPREPRRRPPPSSVATPRRELQCA
jgi:hypothetical protein